MNTIPLHAFYFLVGFFQDLLITYHYQAVSKERAVPASLTSTLITLVNISILYTILGSIESEIFSIIFVYALGNGFGTYVIIRRHELRNIRFLNLFK